LTCNDSEDEVFVTCLTHLFKCFTGLTFALIYLKAMQMLLGTSTYDESVGDFRADDSKDAVEDEVFVTGLTYLL
jgi:hypothetical protein